MFNTIRHKIKAIALTLLLAVVFSSITAQAQTVTSRAIAPSKSNGKIYATGYGYSSHQAREIKILTILYQFNGGRWQPVKSQWTNTYGFGFRNTVSVPCTGPQTPNYFYTWTGTYTLYSNGTRRGDSDESPMMILKC